MNKIKASSEDSFVQSVLSDVKYYLTILEHNRQKQVVLLFPPLNNYRRFLIHKTVEECSNNALNTLSVGCLYARRTVVFKSMDNSIADDTKMTLAIKDEKSSTPFGKNKKLPTAQIYQPPAARTNDSSISPAIVVDKKSRSRLRKPDRAVYVPRAKRILLEADDDEKLEMKQETSIPVIPVKMVFEHLDKNEIVDVAQNAKLGNKLVTFDSEENLHNNSQIVTDEDSALEYNKDRDVWVMQCKEENASGKFVCDASENETRSTDCKMEHSIKEPLDSVVCVLPNENSDNKSKRVILNRSRFVKPDYNEVAVIVNTSIDSLVSNKSEHFDDQLPINLNNCAETPSAQIELTEQSLNSSTVDKDADNLDDCSKDLSLSLPSEDDSKIGVRNFINISETDLAKAIKEPNNDKNSKVNNIKMNVNDYDWDEIFNDDGEYIDDSLMVELMTAIGNVSVKQASQDYSEYQSIEERTSNGECIIEIYGFPIEFKTSDLVTIFAEFEKDGFQLSWVDDTHALGIFSSPTVADIVLNKELSFVKTRPLKDAISQSRRKAKNFVLPPVSRPKTCVALARRLLSGALGMKIGVTDSQRMAERKLLLEAKEKKKLVTQQKHEIWESSTSAAVKHESSEDSH